MQSSRSLKEAFDFLGGDSGVTVVIAKVSW